MAAKFDYPPGATPLDAVELRDLLEDTKYQIEHAACAPDEITGRFRHRLVAIHLSSNGNGRRARLLADLLL